MDFGELVDVGLVVDKHDSDCYFCNAKEDPKEMENDLEPDPSDDDEELAGFVPGGKAHVNDSAKLTTNCGGNPGAKTFDLDGKEYDVTTAAHHLIPGNGSLKKSGAIMGHLGTNGMAVGNVGYDVNSSPNGEFLPGNYALRPWKGKAAAFKDRYAFASIKEWQAQFHDAHRKYNNFVKGTLDKIAQKLKETEDQPWCPESKPPDDEDAKPLYHVVNRLHTLSGRLRKMLVFPTTNWKKNIYTSSRSMRYMDQVDQHQNRT